MKEIKMDIEYPIITLCGSTKFKEEYIETYESISLQGYIVLSVACFSHADNKYGKEVDIETKAMIDAMHLSKISISDAVVVINKDNYIGESTAREIEFAKRIGKPVLYLYQYNIHTKTFNKQLDELIFFDIPKACNKK